MEITSAQPSTELYVARSRIILMLSFLVLVPALGWVFWIYSAGLDGPFLLDDFHNLNGLTNLRGELSWNGVVHWLNTGVAGPTGRPLALLSFVADAHAWPSDPGVFKERNVLFHMVNGLLLFWLTLLLIERVKGFSLSHVLVAMFLAMAWSFSPYHVSTVLYVVQRMAILSALFVLLGLIIYMKGRLRLEEGRTGYGYALIILAYAVGLGLGVLSKENAALFVIMVPLMEWLFFPVRRILPEERTRRHLYVVIGLPLMLFLVAALVHIPGLLEQYRLERNFSISERLLTQMRALGYYLWRYIIPGQEYIGVYGDGFPKSTSLVTPPGTLIWMLVHGMIITLALAARRRAPLFAFGALFFYVGHLMESSLVPVELFFEHRNYLPSAFLYMGLMSLVIGRALQALPALVIASALLLHLHVLAWGDSSGFATAQVYRNPGSERAAVAAADWYLKHGDPDLAYVTLRNHDAEYGLRVNASLIRARAACHAGLMTEEEIGALLTSAAAHEGRVRAELLVPLARLVRAGRCGPLEFSHLRTFLDTYRAAPPHTGLKEQFYFGSLAMLELYAGNPGGWRDAGIAAVKAHPDADITLKVCGALGQRRQVDGCSCLLAGEHAFEGNAGMRFTLTRVLTGYANDLRRSYAEMKGAFCGGVKGSGLPG